MGIKKFVGKTVKEIKLSNSVLIITFTDDTFFGIIPGVCETLCFETNKESLEYFFKEGS